MVANSLTDSKATSRQQQIQQMLLARQVAMQRTTRPATIMAPQMAVIDRKGMVRAQSPPLGDANLQDEAKLRALIESLLKEGPAQAKR